MKRLIALAALALVGCHNPTMLPNPDSSLNKTRTQFATDAAARFPYPAALPRGGELPARAEIGYDWNVITLVNFSGGDFVDCELWVNRQYVLPLEKVESGKTKRLAFKILYNDKNEHLPENGTMIQTLEMKLDGKLYDVPMQIGG